PERPSGLGEGDHLGVGGRVVELLALVVGPGNDPLAPVNDDGPDRDLVGVGGEAGFLQGHFHVQDVERVAGVGEREVEGEAEHGMSNVQGPNPKECPKPKPQGPTKRATAVGPWDLVIPWALGFGPWSLSQPAPKVRE